MLHFCCRMVSCSCALFFFFLSESIIGDSMFKPKPKKIDTLIACTSTVLSPTRSLISARPKNQNVALRAPRVQAYGRCVVRVNTCTARRSRASPSCAQRSWSASSALRGGERSAPCKGCVGSVGRSVVGTPDRFPIERRVFVGLEHPRQRVGPRVWRKSKKIQDLASDCSKSGVGARNRWLVLCPWPLTCYLVALG